MRELNILLKQKEWVLALKLPHINDSDIDFKIEGKGIRFGLSGLSLSLIRLQKDILQHDHLSLMRKLKNLLLQKVME
jgi:DNA polymerase III alpha subunit